MTGLLRISRFLMTGVIGLTVNLSSLHLLVRYAGLHYLVGSVCAFTLSLIVGFLLQKYWTFRNQDASRVRAQFAQYTALALTNLLANTLIVYILVEHLHAHYLIAQTIGAGSIAVVSYLIYRSYIFRDAL